MNPLGNHNSTACVQFAEGKQTNEQNFQTNSDSSKSKPNLVTKDLSLKSIPMHGAISQISI